MAQQLTQNFDSDKFRILFAKILKSSQEKENGIAQNSAKLAQNRTFLAQKILQFPENKIKIFNVNVYSLTRKINSKAAHNYHKILKKIFLLI